MIKYIEGNLLESEAQVLVNTVNTVGIMGKGIALQFKKTFPLNYKLYKKACDNKEVMIGKLFITTEKDIISGTKTIINFPTKTSWRLPSEYEYIEKGLIALRQYIIQNNIQSIAIPYLGVGNGGLNLEKVKTLIAQYLGDLNSEIFIYEPMHEIQEQVKKERIKLTPARAMLLSVLYDLVKNGEFVSEFASEKIAYFLQRFGAQQEFKLSYIPYSYGPYSGKVRHLLYYLNGSYIVGYSGKDKKPFEPISLLMETEQKVIDYLQQSNHLKYLEVVNKTKHFLDGFYSPFSLELLSTIDFIAQEQQTTDIEQIIVHLKKWSFRKTKLFSNQRFIKIALEQLSVFN